jgi:hypothetical protein
VRSSICRVTWKVRAHVLVDKREAQLLQLLADLHHRRHIALEPQYIAAQAMDLLDIALAQRAAQHVALQFIDLGVDRLAHRLVVFGDEIQQCIQYEIFPMLQQQRARLTTLADKAVGRRVTIACGNDVALTGKDMGLDKLQLAVLAHR